MLEFVLKLRLRRAEVRRSHGPHPRCNANEKGNGKSGCAPRIHIRDLSTGAHWDRRSGQVVLQVDGKNPLASYKGPRQTYADTRTTLKIALAIGPPDAEQHVIGARGAPFRNAVQTSAADLQQRGWDVGSPMTEDARRSGRVASSNDRRHWDRCAR